VALAGRFVILGGDEGACPRNADCAPPADPPRRDGAAYNPTLRSWAPIAEAPRGLRSLQTHAVVGNVLYVLLKDDLLAYDGVADAWTRPPGPPAGHRGGRLVDLGGRPAVIAEERRTGEAAADAVYDPTSRSWTKLPADPLGPSFDRVLTDTPAGAVLTGKKLVPAPGSAEPAIVRAALLSRDLQTWKRLPDSDLIGGYTWSWTGKCLIDPSLGSADGGEVDGWGRSVPYGGSFDPVTRTWDRLLNAPEQAAGRNAWPVDALGGPVSARDGYLHDDRTGTWDRITRPDGAPPYPGSAAWLGDTLFVLGGQFDYAGGPQRLSGSAWSLTVGTA
jgi:hypothetical protein